MSAFLGFEPVWAAQDGMLGVHIGSGSVGEGSGTSSFSNRASASASSSSSSSARVGMTQRLADDSSNLGASLSGSASLCGGALALAAAFLARKAMQHPSRRASRHRRLVGCGNTRPIVANGLEQTCDKVALAAVASSPPSSIPARTRNGKTGSRSVPGVILMNIGTPATTETEDVREYLGRFLGDDRVLDVQPSFLKYLLLQVLLATRPEKAAENYRRIWDSDRGSPLLYHSEDLKEALQQELGDKFVVKLGMAYSEPFVGDSLKELAAQGVDDVLLVPMFPQYASSTTGSILANAYSVAAESFCTPYLRVLPPFFDNESYLNCMRDTLTESLGEGASKVDHVLFSFHGIPERQCTATDDSGEVCLQRPDCCAFLQRENRNCYRAQCYESARLLAAKLGLADDKWSIGFQSRLTLRGTVQWIRPYTDELLESLARRGVEKLAILAPSFTADCVETLDELGNEGREEFEAAGGKELMVLPCLNSSPNWVKTLGSLVREQVPDLQSES